MKSKKRLLTTLLASTVALTPMVGVAFNGGQVVDAVAVQQNQGRRFVSLGASLNSDQASQTKNLLGASDIPESSITYVDGTLINRYLNDGSNAGTPVYSSAYIEEKDAGFGVQVQVVTPQNILVVTPQTYQNAAITAGAKNALIKIATVTPVTGEGALTGVYAMLENAGVKVNQKDVQVAQKEITVVSDIEEKTNLTNVEVNQLVADIKTEVTNILVNNGTIDESTTNNIINNSTQNVNISEEDLNKIIDTLKEYINDYKETEAAQNEETVEQLEQSITEVAQPWSSILTTLDANPEATGEVVFPEGVTPNEAIQAFANQVKANAESGTSSRSVYSHTFIYEMTQKDLTEEDKHALNAVRSTIYQLEAKAGDEERAANGLPSTKDTMIQMLSNWDANQTSDANLAAIIKEIALKTGLAPQAYEYRDFSQDGKVISAKVYENTPTHDVLVGEFKYDLETGEVYAVDEVTQEEKLASFDLGTTYGVNITNNATPSSIPVDYTIPGYTPTESNEDSEESSSQKSQHSEEVVEETPETEEVAPEAVEPTQEQAPAQEEVVQEEVAGEVVQ